MERIQQSSSSSSGDGFSKSVELHLGGHVSRVTLHAAAHATVADLLSAAISASTRGEAGTAGPARLTSRALAKDYSCTDTTGTKVALHQLASAAPLQLVVKSHGHVESVTEQGRGSGEAAVPRRGGRGGRAAAAAESDPVSSGGVVSRQRGRGGRGRGGRGGAAGGRGRRSGSAKAKGRVFVDADKENDDEEGEEGEEEEGEEDGSGSKEGDISDQSAEEGEEADASDKDLEEEEEDGEEDEEEEGDGSSGEDEDASDSGSGESADGDDDGDDGDEEESDDEDSENTGKSSSEAEEEEEEEESEGESSQAASSTTRGRTSRARKTSSKTTATAARGRGRVSARGRGTARGVRTAAAPAPAAAAPPVPAPPPPPPAAASTSTIPPIAVLAPASARRSGRRSRAPLLFTPDGIPIKRKRGRPPKSQQIAYAAALAAATAAAAAAAAAAAGGSSPTAPTTAAAAAKRRPASKTAAKTTRGASARSTKAAVAAAEEPRVRRPYRRRNLTAAAETEEATQAVTVASVEEGSSQGGVRGRRTAAAADEARDKTSKKRSRSPSSSSSAAAAVAVMAVDVDGGSGGRGGRRTRSGSAAADTLPATAGAPRVFSPEGSGEQSGGLATADRQQQLGAGDAGLLPSSARARGGAVVDQQQQQRRMHRLQEEEDEELQLRMHRRRVRLTYNVFYPSSPQPQAQPAGSAGMSVGAVCAEADRAGDGATSAAGAAAGAALKNREAGEGRAPKPRSVWNTSGVSLSDHADIHAALLGILERTASRVATQLAASPSASSTPSAVESMTPEQLYRLAHRTVSAWRAEHHRTPSLLLSHPYAMWLMPGMRVYAPPRPSLLSPPPHKKKPVSAVKQEADEEELLGGSVAGDELKGRKVTTEAGGDTPCFCYANQSVVVPLVVGGCVQLVNPESKDKSHQWTVYVRGLWNGHPEEVANQNTDSASQLAASPSAPDATAASASNSSDAGGPGNASLLADSQASILSATSVTSGGAAAASAGTGDYLSDFIEKVVFVLDESFVPCVRTVHSAPFELTEVGWGEFIVSIHVYLKVPAATRTARRVQDRLLQYYCGFNGRTVMQTTDGRGTKPHDPVSTFASGGVRGARNLWTALTTAPPTTSGAIPPTPARSLSDLRHHLQYDSLLDINSNSGARGTYYRGPYLPLHLVDCDGLSASDDDHEDSSSSSSSSGDSGSECSGGERRSCASPACHDAHAFPSAPLSSAAAAEATLGCASVSSSRSGSRDASVTSQELMGVSATSMDSGDTSGEAPQAPAVPGAAVASPPSLLPSSPSLVRRGPGRRPRRVGAPRGGSASDRGRSTPGSPRGAAGNPAFGGARKPYTEVHVGHGSNVVVLQHLLRFSHRPRYPPTIPPGRDPRMLGLVHPDLLGYTMVAEPVVTEQYDELVIPLAAFLSESRRRDERCDSDSSGDSDDDEQRTGFRSGGEGPPRPRAAAEFRRVQSPQLRRLLASASRLEARLRATLRRQLSLQLESTTTTCSGEPPYASPTASAAEGEAPSVAVAPLSTAEAQVLGHPGGISSWPQVLDYGNGIERDTAYTAAYLSSIARTAEQEGWLGAALQQRRAELFEGWERKTEEDGTVTTAAAAVPCASVLLCTEDEIRNGRPGEGVEERWSADDRQSLASMGDTSGRVSSGTAVCGRRAWVTALEYDVAALLMRLPTTAAHEAFFDLVLPRAEDVAVAVWADLCSGITQLSASSPQQVPVPSAGVVKSEPVWASSALQQPEEEEASLLPSAGEQRAAAEARRRAEAALRHSPAALSLAYPLCVLRSSDAGIAALRSFHRVRPPTQQPRSQTASAGGGSGAGAAGLQQVASTSPATSPVPSTAHAAHSLHASSPSRGNAGYSLNASAHGGGSGGGVSAASAHQDAFMASLLKDGQSRGSFGHDGDVSLLVAWKTALEAAIDGMRLEASRRQAAAVLEEL